MLNQSFRQVFVTNTPVLLASGSTEDLAVSQVGIFDGNTYQATVTPTYATNKALQISQGMPDTFWLPLMAGIPQTNQHSKLIKGKLISKFRKKTAHEGQTRSDVAAADRAANAHQQVPVRPDDGGHDGADGTAHDDRSVHAQFEPAEKRKSRRHHRNGHRIIEGPHRI